MTAATVEAVYAAALLGLAPDAAAADAIAADCHTLAASLRQVPQLLALADSPRLSRAEAKALLARCFADRLRPELVNLLHLLVDRNRLGDLLAILAEVRRQADATAGRLTVAVTSAVPLPQTQQAELETTLRRQHGEALRFAYQVEEDLITGLRLRLADTVVDSSARRHLTEMKRRILQAPLAAVWEDADHTTGDSA